MRNTYVRDLWQLQYVLGLHACGSIFQSKHMSAGLIRETS